MKKIILLSCINTVQFILHSQPYLDVVKLNYSHSPTKGLNEKKNSLESNYFSADVILPIELKKGGDAFLINPFFTNNEGTVSTGDFHVQSAGVFIGFLKKDIFKDWNLLTSFIVRKNKEAGVKLDDAWQYGGVILATWKKNQDLSFKFGLYYNKEFFGNYFMALAGIDWKINEKTNLFGVLPGSMVLERKATKRFYYGFAFRALTNSYRLHFVPDPVVFPHGGKKYLRIDDNQLGIYADTYLSKKIVLSAETGYTILRRYRYGFKYDDVHYKTDYKNDNFYFKASLAYRLRLR